MQMQDPVLRKRIDELSSRVTKSQRQTPFIIYQASTFQTRSCANPLPRHRRPPLRRDAHLERTHGSGDGPEFGHAEPLIHILPHQRHRHVAVHFIRTAGHDIAQERRAVGQRNDGGDIGQVFFKGGMKGVRWGTR
jgi:hypothetical protein